MAVFTFSAETLADLREILGEKDLDSMIAELERTVWGVRVGRRRVGPTVADVRLVLKDIDNKARRLQQAIRQSGESVRQGLHAPAVPEVDAALTRLSDDIKAEQEWLRRPAKRPKDAPWRSLCIHVAFLLLATGRKVTTGRPGSIGQRRSRGAVLWRTLEVMSREVRGDRDAPDLSRDVRMAVAYVKANPWAVRYAHEALDRRQKRPSKSPVL